MSIQTVHSDFGGSVAYRVVNCAGSIALVKSGPRRPTSAEADKGTWAHALAAYCLEQGYTSANAFRHQSLPAGVEVPPQYSGQPCDEVVDAVNVFLDAVYDENALTDDAELFIETDVTLPFMNGEVFGRCDAAVWHPSIGRLRTFDFKNGAGMVVDVEDNDQAFFYAAGLVAAHPDWVIQQAVNTIVQPNPWQVAAGTMAAVKDQEIPPFDLTMWQFGYQAACEMARLAETEFHGQMWRAAEDVPWSEQYLKAGPWCEKTFCDAIATCPAYQARALAEAGLKFADVAAITIDDLPSPKDLDMARLERVVAATALLSTWANKCLEHLEALMMSGHRAEHWKVVEKLGRRKYVKADAEITSFLQLIYGVPEDVSTVNKLQTLTEMKKILKQHGATQVQIDDFELRFTLKESSGLTIAPASDKRPSVTPAAADFGSVNITVP